MNNPVEAVTLRRPHPNEKVVSDCIEEKIIFDLNVVEYFTATTFDNKNFDKGTCVEMDRYGFNITTPFEKFKQAMSDAGLLKNLKNISE